MPRCQALALISGIETQHFVVSHLFAEGLISATDDVRGGGLTLQ